MYPTELEPIARARRAEEEFYQTLTVVRCVSFPLIVVESIQPTRTITEVPNVCRMPRAVWQLRDPAFT